jgi:hypothetical protein
MAQLLGTEELHSFVAYSLINYDYAYNTKVDLFLCYLAQNLLSHLKFHDKIKIILNVK